MITADTITTQQTVDIFHALAAATDKAKRVMRLAEDSKISPHMAASMLNDLLANLQSKLGRDEP